jgi:hypothetical protein
MNVTLTELHESETCTWCERTKQCVTSDFGDGFIRKAPLCWRCLQKAVKVRNRQQASSGSAKSSTG